MLAQNIRAPARLVSCPGQKWTIAGSEMWGSQSWLPTRFPAGPDADTIRVSEAQDADTIHQLRNVKTPAAG
jgi:hypothetical protein